MTTDYELLAFRFRLTAILILGAIAISVAMILR